MDFDNRKVHGDTSITDGLVSASFVFKQLGKRPNKKSNFVEESLDVELNVIWIPGHLWNTNLEQQEVFSSFDGIFIV